MTKIPEFFIIAGPTATGKTHLAIELAVFLQKQYGVLSEIINADSIQLHDDLKILTAYPSCEELSQIPHNLYGILSAFESASVASWLELAREKIQILKEQKKIAILCGGTGFYINAILNGLSKIPDVPKEFRDDVKQKFDKIGRDAFFDELKILDPRLTQTLHKNNTQRILRAYEVVKFTGKSISDWWINHDDVQNNSSVVVLLPPIENIYSQCFVRIKKMITAGVLQEVADFNEKYPDYIGSLDKVIGYKEITASFKNFISEEILIEQIYIKTKQYAKRQSTWFRNKSNDNAIIIHEFGNNADIIKKII